MAIDINDYNTIVLHWGNGGHIAEPNEESEDLHVVGPFDSLAAAELFKRHVPLPHKVGVTNTNLVALRETAADILAKRVEMTQRGHWAPIIIESPAEYLSRTTLESIHGPTV